MRILPEGFGWKVLAAMAAAVAGNILVQYVIPWPDFMKASYGAAAEILGDYPVGVYLLLTLLIAPLVEEGIFRRGIYAVFRRWLGVTPAAFLSALAFGLYHGTGSREFMVLFLGCFLPGDMRAVLLESTGWLC